MTTILLLEDDRDLAQIWSRLLQMKGYSVLAESSVREALDRLISNQIDLVITDINIESTDESTMPGGHVMLDAVLKRRETGESSIPVIAVSGDLSLQVQAHKKVVDLFLSKPISLSELIDGVENLLHAPQES